MPNPVPRRLAKLLESNKQHVRGSRSRSQFSKMASNSEKSASSSNGPKNLNLRPPVPPSRKPSPQLRPPYLVLDSDKSTENVERIDEVGDAVLEESPIGNGVGHELYGGAAEKGVFSKSASSLWSSLVSAIEEFENLEVLADVEKWYSQVCNSGTKVEKQLKSFETNCLQYFISDYVDDIEDMKSRLENRKAECERMYKDTLDQHQQEADNINLNDDNNHADDDDDDDVLLEDTPDDDILATANSIKDSMISMNEVPKHINSLAAMVVDLLDRISKTKEECTAHLDASTDSIREDIQTQVTKNTKMIKLISMNIVREQAKASKHQPSLPTLNDKVKTLRAEMAQKSPEVMPKASKEVINQEPAVCQNCK